MVAASAHGAVVEPGAQQAFMDESLMFGEVPSVFSVSRYEEGAPEAPASITVITRDMIRQHGYRSVAEILGGVRGFTTSSDGSYTYVGVRGILRPGDYNSRVLLMVDGHRLNDAVYDGALAGNEGQIDVEMIERIEVTRGPGSSVYGANAMLAVVNILTRQARSIQGSEGAVELDTKSLRRARVVAAGRWAGAETLVSLSSASRKGQGVMGFESAPAGDAPANWHARYLDGERFQRALINVAWRSVALSAGHSERHKNVPTAPYDTEPGVTGTNVRDQRDWVSLSGNHEFSASNEVRGRVAIDRYRYYGNYAYREEDSNLPYTGRDDASAQWYTGEMSWLHRSTQHTFLAGLDLTKRPLLVQRYEGTSVALDDRRQSDAIGLYAQDTWRVSPVFQVVAGMRYDRHHSDVTHSATSPRLAAVWRASTADVVKLLFGRAYRPANAYETYYADGGESQKPGLGVSPEHVRSTELSWDRSIGLHNAFSASLYAIRYRNVIEQVQDSDGLLVYQNIAEIRTQGMEAEWRYHSDTGVSLQVGASFLDTRQNPADLPRSTPSRQLFGKLAVPMPFGESMLGLEWRHVSQRENARGERIAPYNLVNLVLSSAEIGRFLRWRVGLYNLANAHYADPVGREIRAISVPQEGRVLSIQITYAM
ncbi:MAG: hypothetical protein RJA63_1542 [Pseudomonadota bacterium]